MPIIDKQSVVLILGSAPDAVRAREWQSHPFDSIVAINNAWRVRSDWTYSVFPSDFPKEKHAVPGPGQHLRSADDYVEAQNSFGGFVYAGGTMAFTAAYWALCRLKPDAICFLGCDMVYPEGEATHFYGMGEPDPLRPDMTLRNLEAKSARFAVLADKFGCQVFNLSEQPESRLIFPRASLGDFQGGSDNPSPMVFDERCIEKALALEKKLGYFIESGEYWKYFEQFDSAEIERLDKLWLASVQA